MKALFDYFHPLERLKRIRKQYLNNQQMPTPLSEVVAQPCPEISDLAKSADFIVLDLETTGLDSDKDIILSIGWINIHKGYIDMASARHLYLNNDLQVKAETAVINHITPQMLAEGIAINDALLKFFAAAQGKIIVAHACVVEKNFINSYLQKNWGIAELPLVWLDTLCIEKRLANAVSHQQDIDLTLAETRKRYNLPEYNGHNALADAISTAELLLVQQKRIAPKSDVTIGQLYKMSI